MLVLFVCRILLPQAVREIMFLMIIPAVLNLSNQNSPSVVFGSLLFYTTSDWLGRQSGQPISGFLCPVSRSRWEYELKLDSVRKRLFVFGLFAAKDG